MRLKQNWTLRAETLAQFGCFLSKESNFTLKRKKTEKASDVRMALRKL